MKARGGFVLVLCAVIGGSACGKKGPPLAPLVRLPAPVGDFSARRLSQDVILQFTIPTANSDGSRPADLDRIEVYAHTGALRAPADYVTQGTLIGTVAVKPPPVEPTEGNEQPAKAAVAKAAEAVDQRADPGTRTSVLEMLTPDGLAVTPPAAPTPPAPTPPNPPNLVGTPSEASKTPPSSTTASAAQKQPSRYYVAVGRNRRGRMGALSPVIGVPLVPAPPAPAKAEVAYDEKQISITWEPVESPGAVDAVEPSVVPPDAPAAPDPPVVVPDAPAAPEPPVVVPVPDPAAAPEPPVADSSDTPSRDDAFGYNIYEAPAQDSPAEKRTVSAPLNPSPVTTAELVLTSVEFGRARCYLVRAVATVDKVMIESEPSPAACVTPVDTFAPAAPRALAAVATANAVSLIWEANTEPDLAGYLVLRGEAPGETLTPLTPVPIRETTFTDTQVRPAVTYVYAVVAQDNATPPNVSEYSDQKAVIPR